MVARTPLKKHCTLISVQLSTHCCQHPPKGLGTDKTVETTWRRRTQVNTRHVHAMQKKKKKKKKKVRLGSNYFGLICGQISQVHRVHRSQIAYWRRGKGRRRGERVSGSTTCSDPESPRRQWGHSCCLNCCADQSHKDSVHSTAEAKEVQLSEPNSTCLLLISPGLS